MKLPKASRTSTVTALIVLVGRGLRRSPRTAGRPRSRSPSLTTFLVVGISLGGIYAISALGLVVTYSTTGIFNFAHGSIGAFLAFTLLGAPRQSPLAGAVRPDRGDRGHRAAARVGARQAPDAAAPQRDARRPADGHRRSDAGVHGHHARGVEPEHRRRAEPPPVLRSSSGRRHRRHHRHLASHHHRGRRPRRSRSGCGHCSTAPAPASPCGPWSTTERSPGSTAPNPT